MGTILVTGACGQLGTELVAALRTRYGNEKIIATDIIEPGDNAGEGPYEKLDVLDRRGMEEIAEAYGVSQIYHLASLLSARAEQNIGLAWELNMGGLLNVLNLARDKGLEKVYWPSSIAVFGPDAPKKNTPQHTALNPTTVYGISKVAGEQWCAYYHNRFGVDVRSLRYPGLIGYKSLPGGGTTDYAVDIYHKALSGEPFECFLRQDSQLPMMYMDDAIKATLDLMEADSEEIKIRTSYNLAAISFTPAEIADSIRKLVPGFEILYRPDQRQDIADSWPDSIGDEPARNDWGWNHAFSLDRMTEEILEKLPGYWKKFHAEAAEADGGSRAETA